MIRITSRHKGYTNDMIDDGDDVLTYLLGPRFDYFVWERRRAKGEEEAKGDVRV